MEVFALLLVSYELIFVLTLCEEDNEIYMKNKLLKEESENLETGVFKASTEYFRGGNIVTLGGSYRNKYAIIKDV